MRTLMEEGRAGEMEGGRAATVCDNGWDLFPGEKVDSEEGKDLPKVSGLSHGAGVPPAQPLASYFQAIACPYPLPAPDSLTACCVPRHCGCDPCTGLLGGCDRTGPPGRTPPNTGLQPGPQWGGPSGHCGLGHLPGRHAGLDRCLSVGWVGLCTSNPPPPGKSFLRSNLTLLTTGSTLWAQGPTVV